MLCGNPLNWFEIKAIHSLVEVISIEPWGCLIQDFRIIGGFWYSVVIGEALLLIYPFFVFFILSIHYSHYYTHTHTSRCTILL